MNKSSDKELRSPMLQCLKRIIGGLSEKLQTVKNQVEKNTGKKLNLEVISIFQKADDDFRIKVRGISFSGHAVEKEFQVVWWGHTCPTSFHLLRWDHFKFDFIYCGVIAANPEILAKEIAIYTYGKQIPEVLSRY
ncbi:MAG: hypothetical protein HGB03_02975 [Candidatus Yonathbacteria bacterium]|nr:hypothetical protein [Candidatus Yonathbacteria bacterium]NTW47402.1 hypothetical protein [Candidatus Yonathbacteria bacterium]